MGSRWDKVTPRLPVTIALVYVAVFIALPSANAGPPFRTDDPETVEYKHGEFYVASQYANDKAEVSSTAPHFEVNYGILPNVQLHVLVPFGYNRPWGEPTLYEFQDLELGMKYRFIQESDYLPMVGTFPVVHLPTGNDARGLGNGKTSSFFLCGSKKVGNHGKPMEVVATGLTLAPIS